MNRSPRSWRVGAAALALGALLGCGPEVSGLGPAVTAPSLEPGGIRAADGTFLTLHEARPAGPPRGVVLLLHGLSNHGGHIAAEDAPPLTARGMIVYGYDQRGHGRTPVFGVWPGEEALVTDAVAAIRLLRARHPDLPFHVGGLSMGANVALLASDRLKAAGEAGLVDRWVLLSAGLWTEEDLRLLRRVALTLGLTLAPRLGGASRPPPVPTTDNAESADRIDSDPLTVMDMRPDLVAGLIAMNASSRAAVARCCAGPTLFLFGANDALIEPEPTVAALRRLPAGAPARVGYYRQGWHMLLRDNQRAVVAEDLMAFIADPRAPLPSGAEEAAQGWMAADGRDGSERAVSVPGVPGLVWLRAIPSRVLGPLPLPWAASPPP
jgi:acylglycerol lipase